MDPERVVLPGRRTTPSPGTSFRPSLCQLSLGGGMALLSQDRLTGWPRTTSSRSTMSSLSSLSCPRPQAASLFVTLWKTGGTGEKRPRARQIFKVVKPSRLSTYQNLRSDLIFTFLSNNKQTHSANTPWMVTRKSLLSSPAELVTTQVYCPSWNNMVFSMMRLWPSSWMPVWTLPLRDCSQTKKMLCKNTNTPSQQIGNTRECFKRTLSTTIWGYLYPTVQKFHHFMWKK